MTQKTNSFERFWQELKRRKTGKVIIAYAATAFILLQLADILTPALLLPDWTTRLITLIIIIGFPVAVIFSWVFDISPQGIIKTESVTESEKKGKIAKPSRKVFTIGNIVIAVLLVVVVVLAYPKMFKRDALERLRSSGERISVAVMPFRNMTNDTSWNIWQDGIQEILTTSLSNSEELKVSQTENVKSIIQSKGLANYASMTPSFAKTISQNLDANVFVFGNIIQAGNTLRIHAQLIDTKTKEILKPFQIDGYSEEKDIFRIIDTLSVQLKNFLLISKLKKGIRTDFQQFATTSSPEAYRYFIYGNNAFYNIDYPTACNWLLQAINADSNFVGAMVKLSYAYGNQGLIEEAKKWCLNAFTKKNFTSDQQKIFIDLLYAGFFETPNEQLKAETQLLTIDDQLPIIYYRKGLTYNGCYQYDKAIPEFERALDIYNKWDVKPAWINNYSQLGLAYHKTGQYKKEKILYKNAEKDFPDNPNIIYRQAILALSEGETKDANKYIEKYITIRKETSVPEASIMNNIAGIYSEAGILEKAEEYYRQALSLEPENPIRKNNLAYFLIDKDLNVKEGLELTDKVLGLSPDDYASLHSKGWGLYKQGKYKEALDILQKSWDLRMKNAIYGHTPFLHLEAAKKAVAELKNN
jgi:tetratricopeptide (TPR) repeat protein